jgi:hypothetical protein
MPFTLKVGAIRLINSSSRNRAPNSSGTVSHQIDRARRAKRPDFSLRLLGVKYPSNRVRRHFALPK